MHSDHTYFGLKRLIRKDLIQIDKQHIQKLLDKAVIDSRLGEDMI